mgnify:CR=1 FL=1
MECESGIDLERLRELNASTPAQVEEYLRRTEYLEELTKEQKENGVSENQ